MSDNDPRVVFHLYHHNQKTFTSTKIPLSYFLYVHQLLRNTPALKKVIPTVEAFIGLARVCQFSASYTGVKSIANEIADPTAVPYLTEDLVQIGEMDQRAISEMGERLYRIVPQVLTRPNGDRYLQNIRNQPEIYAMLARASYYRKRGPQPNQISDELRKKFPEDQLQEGIALALLPALVLNESEQETIRAIRESILPPKVGCKVVSKTDFRKYLKGEYKEIVGFWGDARLYHGRKRDEMVYSFLRLDYPNSQHKMNREEKTYAILFDVSDIAKRIRKHIPFSFEMFHPSFDLSHLPEQPFTGTGFTSARNGEFVPEYYTTREHPISLKKGAKLGYFDLQGFFQTKYVYDGLHWKSVYEQNQIRSTYLDRPDQGIIPLLCIRDEKNIENKKSEK